MGLLALARDFHLPTPAAPLLTGLRRLRAAAAGSVGRPTRKRINLALQGGGAHGAFTWGVLDRLLEEPDLEIVGISGASAGAMNAVVTADGLARGGRHGARDALEAF